MKLRRLLLLSLLASASAYALPRPMEDALNVARKPFPVYVTHTGSMRPTLNGGEILLVYPAPIENVRVGDVVVFRWPARAMTVIHRVVRIKNALFGGVGLVCQGDANTRPDAITVTAPELLGVAFIPATEGGRK